ncbi:hypothetical protein ACFRA1_21905, partial [Bacillus subtilis]
GFGAGGLADKLNRFISSYVEESEENILG